MSEGWAVKRQCSQYNMCELGKFNIESAKTSLFFCIFVGYCPLKYLGVFLWTTRNEKRLEKNLSATEKEKHQK